MKFAKLLESSFVDTIKDLIESDGGPSHPLDAHPVLHNFLHHLCSPLMHDPKVKNSHKMNEAAHSIEHIKSHGIEALNKTMGEKGLTSPHEHMRQGFHAAFPEHEDEETTKKKAVEAQKHFHKFMHERGGQSATGKPKLYGGNKKTRSSAGANYKTVGLSLSPSKESGYKHDLCPNATSECRKNCLGLTAGGNKQYPIAAARGKLLRTQYVHEHPEHAARLMDHELTKNEHDAAKINHHSGVRNNVTSDITWENAMPKKFFEKHHKSTFYDYTKIPGRLDKNRPSNYHLALSHTGANHPESNDKHVADALSKGHVVAMVHQKPKKGAAPATHVHDMASGKHYKITNGDEDDNVFDRHHAAGVPKTEGVVSGLKLKGVKNEAAGKFANKVDHSHYEGKPKDAGGVIHINHPKEHPDHWSHHPEDHEAHYKEHPEKFTRKHKDDKNPFHVMKENWQKHSGRKAPGGETTSPAHDALTKTHGLQHEAYWNETAFNPKTRKEMAVHVNEYKKPDNFYGHSIRTSHWTNPSDGKTEMAWSRHVGAGVNKKSGTGEKTLENHLKKYPLPG